MPITKVPLTSKPASGLPPSLESVFTLHLPFHVLYSSKALLQSLCVSLGWDINNGSCLPYSVEFFTHSREYNSIQKYCGVITFFSYSK